MADAAEEVQPIRNQFYAAGARTREGPGGGGGGVSQTLHLRQIKSPGGRCLKVCKTTYYQINQSENEALQRLTGRQHARQRPATMRVRQIQYYRPLSSRRDPLACIRIPEKISRLVSLGRDTKGGKSTYPPWSSYQRG